MPTTHTIIIGTNRIKYTEFKLGAADQNKSLKQIAREQLGDETLYTQILKKRENPKPNEPIWEEIVLKDRFDPRWTLLLPPAKSFPPSQPPQPPPTSFGTFKVNKKVNVRTSPRVEAGNIFKEFPEGTVYKYKLNSVRNENGMVWVDVTESNLGNKVPGATYWMCVREGSIYHTDPKI
jgi:hypothetical protein